MNNPYRILLAALLLALGLLLCACGEPAAPDPAPAATEAPVPTAEPLPEVRISEVMASNKATLARADGSFPDWLELHNESDGTVSLDGFVLRCGGDSWTIPALSLAPDEYLLVWCGAADSAPAHSLNSGFSISRSGETLGLLDPAGTVVDSVRLPALEQDMSWSLGTDGAASLSMFPSPGFENSRDGYRHAQELRLAPQDAPSIGEVMVYNEWYAVSGAETGDWVEITNFTAQPLELGRYFLSDREAERLLFRLPERTLAPGESLLVLCSDESEEGRAAPFGLGSVGEELYLTREDGVLCDYAALHDIPYGCSLGREAGRGGFFYYAVPSPGAPNAGGVRFTGTRPEALSPDGVFDGVSAVRVSFGGEGILRFTTDGSLPTADSPVYEGPFDVSGTCVVRAVSFREDTLPSEALNLSFILNEGHTLPVVSLVCAPADLFDVKNGIYSNPAERWEKPGCVMFYGEEGDFRIDCGVKLHGATSRLEQNKKSFKLCFRDRYDGMLHYDLFRNGVTDFASILLRAAQEADQSTLMRDNLMHQLAMQAFPELPVQDARYAVLYLNGSYWGVYNIREAHSPTHYAEHYGYDVETVSQWKGSWPQESEFEEVYRYAVNHDLSVEEHYAYVAQHVNVESVIGWCIMQVYSGNIDFNSPNMRFYYSTEDQMLRYALVDLDLGMFDYGSFAAIFGFGYSYNTLAWRLMLNQGFRCELMTRLGEAIRGPLADDNVIAMIDSLENVLRPEMERDCERWGGTMYFWENLVDHLRDYIHMNKGRAMDVVYLLRESGFVAVDEVDSLLPH